MSKIIPGEPSAWEVHVRRIHPEVTDWRRHNIYETLERAQETVIDAIDKALVGDHTETKEN